MSVPKRVLVKDAQELQTLKEFDFSELEEAYEFAAELELMGLNVIVETPTAAESLADALGLSETDRKLFEESTQQELDDHD